MASLHFGVIEDVHYTSGKPVHEVGDILEAKYGVIRHFAHDNEGAIRAMMVAQSEKTVKAMIAGRRPTMKPTLDEFKAMFRRYILAKSLDGRVRGVPTKASLRGVNHTLKHPYAKKNPVRPSFFDTGLYVSAFRAWVK